jgi:hypothetical protein
VIDRLTEADAAFDDGDNRGAAALVDQEVGQSLVASNERSRDLHYLDPFMQKLLATEDLIRHGERERLVVLDPSGRVIVYLRGNGSQVPFPTNRDGSIDNSTLEALEGAHCLTHNHPTGGHRPIGGTFSLSDLVLAQKYQLRHLRVAAAEATYVIAPLPGSRWDETCVDQTQRAYRHSSELLDRTMLSQVGSAERDIYFYLRVFDFLILQLAKRLGFRYERIDQPQGSWQVPTVRRSIVDTAPEHQVVLDETDHFRWVSAIVGRDASSS